MLRRAGAPLAILAAVFVVYANSLGGVFVFDDHFAIDENPEMGHFRPLWKMAWPPPDTAAAGRPVVALSLSLNWLISGKSTWSYHLWNILAHAAAALTLYGIIRRTLRLESLTGRFAPAADALALLATLLWAVHPLHTESVTYISTRTESMMGMFYLLTLYAALRAAQSTRPLGWEASAVLFCLLGMGCKEAMASAPLIVALYDYIFRPDGAGRRRRRWPLYLALAATWLALGALLLTRPRSGSVGFQYHVTAWEYLLTQTEVLLYYLRLAFWPHPLTLDYDHWPIARSLAEVWPAALVVATGLILTLVGLLRRSPTAFLGAWFVAILAPSSSVIPLVTEIVAERRMYLPLAAVIVGLVCGGYGLLRRWGVDRPVPAPRAVRALAALSVVAMVALGVATAAQNRVYYNELRLWERELRIHPTSPRAWHNLAHELRLLGRREEAVQAYQQAVRHRPEFYLAHFSLGTLLHELGRYDEAVDHLTLATRLHPVRWDFSYRLGLALEARGQTDAALEQYRRAAALDPARTEPLRASAKLLVERGEVKEAIEHLQQVLRLDPAQHELRRYLGSLLFRFGQLHEAEAEFRRVLSARPEDAAARTDLGSALGRQGRHAEAIEQFRAAARIQPGDPLVHYNLGIALLHTRQFAEAREAFQKALDLQPRSPEAWAGLGYAWRGLGNQPEMARAWREALTLGVRSGGDNPTWPAVRQDLAWLLATSGDESVRDPQQALHLAEQACRETRYASPGALHALAAAYAACGRFDEAIRTGEQALALARSSASGELAQRIEASLGEFRAGRAVREP